MVYTKSGKHWSGLIRDYYIPRWKIYYQSKTNKTQFDLLKWEENWIKSSDISAAKPFDNPIDMAVQLFNNQYNKN